MAVRTASNQTPLSSKDNNRMVVKTPANRILPKANTADSKIRMVMASKTPANKIRASKTLLNHSMGGNKTRMALMAKLIQASNKFLRNTQTPSRVPISQ